MWPIRSLLFVPAHRRDWVAKATRVSPGAVVLDIEDSVPPEHKAGAVAGLRSAVEELRAAGVAACIRVNGLSDGTEAELAAGMAEGLTAVLLPKASAVAEIRRLHDLLSYQEGRAGLAHGSVGILPLPETAEGMHGAYDLAKASPRVRGIFGAISGPVSGDFARAFGFRATLEGDEQLYLASKLVLDSRAAGAPHPVAAVFGMAMDDLAGVERLVRRARDIGYAGVAVTPGADGPVPISSDDVFKGKTVALIDERTIGEAERAGLGAVQYRGAMVDYAMLPLARSVVAEARRLGG